MERENIVGIKQWLLATVLITILIMGISIQAMHNAQADEKTALFSVLDLEKMERNRATISSTKKWFMTCNLWDAIRSDNEEEVLAMIMEGADVNAHGDKGDTPLMVAVCRDNPKMAMWLLHAKADINATNDLHFSALESAACYQDCSPIIAHLIQAGADVNGGKGTVLEQFMFSSYNTPSESPKYLKSIDNFILLLKAGVYFNKKSRDFTPLQEALLLDRNMHAKILLSAGACPTLKNGEPMTFGNSINTSTRKWFEQALEADKQLAGQDWMPETLINGAFFIECMPVSGLRELIVFYANSYDDSLPLIDLDIIARSDDTIVSNSEFINMVIKNQFKERQRDREMAQQRAVADAGKSKDDCIIL